MSDQHAHYGQLCAACVEVGVQRERQTIARQAAIGAAVERLPRTGDEAIWLIRDVNGRWEAQVVYPLLARPKRSSMREATLPEAIAAALGDDDE